MGNNKKVKAAQGTQIQQKWEESGFRQGLFKRTDLVGKNREQLKGPFRQKQKWNGKRKNNKHNLESVPSKNNVHRIESDKNDKSTLHT